MVGDPVLLARGGRSVLDRGPDLPLVLQAVRKQCDAAGATRNYRADVHGVAVRPADSARLQRIQPDAREPGGSLFTADGKPPCSVVESERVEGRIPLSA